MAKYYMDKNGNITVNQNVKRKPKYAVDEYGNITSNLELPSSVTSNQPLTEKKPKYTMDANGIVRSNIEPVKEEKASKKKEKKKEEDTWFKSGAFGDGKGNFFTDALATVGSTLGDVGVGVAKGLTKFGEGAVDFGMYGVAGAADFLGADNFAKDVRKTAKKNHTESFYKPAEEFVDKYSVLGNKADALSEGVGQVAGILLAGKAGALAKLGKLGVTALTSGVNFISSAGSGMSEAYQSGASDEEAASYGFTKGGIDAGTELMFGGLSKAGKAIGISKGIGGLDDMAADLLFNRIKNQAGKSLAKYGFKAAGEGLEEVAAGYLTAHAKQIYSEEDIDKLMADENLLDQFIVGSLVGGIVSSPSAVRSVSSGRDYTSGFTANEQKVVDAEVERRIAEQETEGKKLNKKEQAAIIEEVQYELKKGYISTDVIESTLVGESDTYKNYQSVTKQEQTLMQKIKDIENDETLTTTQKNDLTNAFKNEIKALNKEQVAGKFVTEMDALTEKDNYLRESYNELGRSKKKFTADLSKYNDKEKEVIQAAMDSEVAGNSNQTHEFVDKLAKIYSDKGIFFKLTNNEKLLEEGRAVDGATVNGYVTEDGVVVLNVDSKKSLNTIVGHEITHTFEKNGIQDKELQDFVIELSKTRGDYDAKWQQIQNSYSDERLKTIYGKDADFEVIRKAELTADLIGDYLFTDRKFIENLSVQKPNIFKRIYEEIKYLLKTFTGSKEARQLEQVKRAFDKAYKQTSNTTEGVNYSLDVDVKNEVTGYGVDKKMNDYIGVQKAVLPILEKEEYFGEVTNEETGMVIDITKKGIKETLGSGKRFQSLPRKLKELKLATIRSLPEMIQKAHLKEDNVANTHGKASNYAYFTVDTDINGVPFTVRIDVQKTSAKNKFWLHNIDITEKNSQLLSPDKNQVLNEIENFSEDSISQNSEKTSIKYSISEDNKGRKLSKEQQEFFKDSKVVDEKGHLLEVYHGTKTTGINKFEYSPDRQTGDDFGEAYYFTSDYVKAQGYSYDVNKDERVKQYQSERERLKKKFLETRAEEDRQAFLNVKVEGKTLHELMDDETYNTGGEVKNVYLNLVNPLIVDAEGDYHYKVYDKYFEEAKSGGYDGLIVKNVIDNPRGEQRTIDVYIAFNNNQIKAVDNTKPTTNADIRYSLSADSKGNALNPVVQKRFEKSKAVDENGALKVLYHGTPSGEFTIFDKSKGSVEGDFGSGFYFTDNEADVSEHYEGGGPDFENKVARRAEQIEAEEDIDYDEAEERARKELYKGSHKFEVYLNIENPAIVGETILLSQDEYLENYDPDDYDDYDDYIAEVEQLVADDIENLVWEVEKNIDIYSTDGLSDVLYEAYYEGGIGVQELKDKINELYLESSEGEMVGNEVARQIVESLGYDGIIDNTVSSKWNMDMEEGTTHYIVFKPNQIKSISNENPTDNPDINLSLSNQNQYIAPVGSYNVYGKDIALETTEEAPVEDIAPVREVAELPTPLTEEMANERDAQQQNINTLEDAPEEIEAPYYAKDEDIKLEDPFDERDIKDVGKRNVKAYMYDNPEVKPYFQQEAQAMLWELQNSVKGEKSFNSQLYYDTNGELGWFGTTRETSDDIAYLLDNFKYTYADIEKGLKAIIEDHGAENNAISKRIEFALNDRLKDGYTDFMSGEEVPANQDYVNLLMDKQIYTYSDEAYYEWLQSLATEEAPPVAPLEPSTDDIAPVREDLETPEGTQRVMDFENNQIVDEFESDTKEQENKLYHKSRKELKQALIKDRENFLIDAMDEAKNVPTLLLNNTDTIRATELVFGRENAKVINKEIFQKAIDNEAKSIAWQNKERADIKKLGIKPKSKESAAVQKYGEKQYENAEGKMVEYSDIELAIEFPDTATQKKIKRAAQVMRNKYDSYIDEANAVLTELGFNPIQKRKDYMRHFEALTDAFSRMGIPFNIQQMKEYDLPTDINGLTDTFVPQKNFFANIMQRKGNKTTLDAVTGIDGYIGGISNLIHHTEDIQRGRAFEDLIRDNYGRKEADKVLSGIVDETAKQKRKQQIADNHLSSYASWVHDWTDNLAGKKDIADRGAERRVGRRIFTVLDTIRKQVGANMIGFNVASSLTNLIAPVQALAKTDKIAFTKGTIDTFKSIFKKDSFMENNSFLTSRMGTDKLSKTWWEKTQDAGFIFMRGMDYFTSNLIVRSKYNELITKGVSEEVAHKEAGQFAARIMGDRTKGANAQLYNSKLFNMVAQFQLEVNNQLYSMFYDTYQESKEKAEGNAARTASGMTFTLGQLFIATHIFGQAFEEIAGYNPTFDLIDIIKTALGLDDEEEEKPLDERLEDASLKLLKALPYSSLFVDGGRIPMGDALPITQFIKGEDEYGNEKPRGETFMEALPYYLLPAGYGQMKKTEKGLNMFDESLPVTGSYTDSGNLRFPVEDTASNRLQAAIFGQWANENARDYFNNERQPLKEKQIQEFADLDIPIQEYWEYREGLKEQDTIEEKFDYIAGLDLPVSKKNILINNVVDREEKVNLINYDDFSGYEEFDFATKNPEKYEFFKSNNISYADYSASEESKEAYSWAYNNPEKYVVSRAVGDVVKYKQYTSELNKLTADKDENGKSISGSRKEKVISYINNMDADYGAKIVLYKSEYPSDNTYNNDIIEYLNNRNDITYEDMATILIELGFTVEADGTVRWD